MQSSEPNFPSQEPLELVSQPLSKRERFTQWLDVVLSDEIKHLVKHCSRWDIGENE